LGRPFQPGTVLFILGLISLLENLADARSDEVGLALQEERLPKRIRQPGKKSKAPK
jgi:hypothetical protein